MVEPASMHDEILVAPASPGPLLVVDELRVEFATDHGWATVVNGVSFSVTPGETVGLVGESGSGKTVTGLSIMRLIPDPPGRITGGSVTFGGTNLTTLAEPALRDIRGNDIAMVFQEPMSSLNPAFTVGQQISETVRRHRGCSRREGMNRAREMLDLVGIPNAAKRVKEYPHEFSGGMRQRVMLAMALCCDPKLVIADEPTTALDVTIQAQVLDLLRQMRDELDMALLLITHDLGVVAETCDRVVVMYAGEVVETSGVDELYAKPRHPYTEGLMRSLPQLGARHARLASIPGRTPEPWNMPEGCRFHPRCDYSRDVCRAGPPPLVPIGDGRSTRCKRDGEIELEGVQ